MSQPLIDELLRQSPVVIVMGIALWLFYSGRIRSQKSYEEVIEDRNFWRDAALRVTNFAESATDVFERRRDRDTGNGTD